MRKISYITILACLSLLTLQSMWLSKTYNSYKEMQLSEIENKIHISISRELSMRIEGYSNKNSQPTLIKFKYASEMTSEEMKSLKGDTLDISALNKMAVGNTLEDVIIQIRQDGSMFKEPLSMTTLDSIFIDIMGTEFDHCFISLDKEKQVTEMCGKDVRNKYNVIKTREFPIGTKGLLYIQAFVKVPLSDYLRSMAYILSISVMIIILVFVILIFQLSVIRKKETQLTIRESCINGTIHDLKSPLGNVITLLA